MSLAENGLLSKYVILTASPPYGSAPASRRPKLQLPSSKALVSDIRYLLQGPSVSPDDPHLSRCLGVRPQAASTASSTPAAALLFGLVYGIFSSAETGNLF